MSNLKMQNFFFSSSEMAEVGHEDDPIKHEVQSLTDQLDKYKKHAEHYKSKCSDYQDRITALELQNKVVTAQNARLTEKYKGVVQRSEETNENVRKVLTSVFQTQSLLKDAKASLHFRSALQF